MSSIARIPALAAQYRRGDKMGWLERHPRKQYFIALFQSCPPWVTRADLKPLEQLAREKTRITGIKHAVDHILPITSAVVCGLTVPWNLRVITQAENVRKSCDLNGEMFDQPEQLRL